ncbi:MAG: S8 family serine peptidase [Candidatus Binatia bacterium]|nr:S8 family serine peptidase [Candidatus Binatia bacterium]
MASVADLRGATGAGVRVALIDSGVNPQHSHVRHVSGGLGFFLTAAGQVQTTADYSDRIGHGTALAGIVRAKAPQVELYAIKIFAERLVASLAVLEAALHWALGQQMHLINLSLGTSNPDHCERMRAVVAEANRRGTLLVAASPPGRAAMLPAALPGVIGVAGDDRCGWEDHWYILDDPVPLRAHPCPRPLPSPAQARNFRGHSFASAHITALLALLLERCPDLTSDEATAYLRRTSRRIPE